MLADFVEVGLQLPQKHEVFVFGDVQPYRQLALLPNYQLERNRNHHAAFLQSFEDFLAVPLADEKGGDVDLGASSVVDHNDAAGVFLDIVHDDG